LNPSHDNEKITFKRKELSHGAVSARQMSKRAKTGWEEKKNDVGQPKKIRGSLGEKCSGNTKTALFTRE